MHLIIIVKYVLLNICDIVRLYVLGYNEINQLSSIATARSFVDYLENGIVQAADVCNNFKKSVYIKDRFFILKPININKFLNVLSLVNKYIQLQLTSQNVIQKQKHEMHNVIAEVEKANKVKSEFPANISHEIAYRHLPDLIILDMLMPDMDGSEVFDELREDGKTRNIPIIALTASNELTRYLTYCEESTNNIVDRQIVSYNSIIHVSEISNCLKNEVLNDPNSFSDVFIADEMKKVPDKLYATGSKYKATFLTVYANRLSEYSDNREQKC